MPQSNYCVSCNRIHLRNMLVSPRRVDKEFSFYLQGMTKNFEQVLSSVVEICKSSVITEIEIEIGPKTALIRDLGLDSLQALELVSEIESTFGVSIPSELLPEIETLEDVARLVVNVQGQGKPL